MLKLCILMGYPRLRKDSFEAPYRPPLLKALYELTEPTY